MSPVDSTGNSGSNALWNFGRWLLAGTATNAATGPDSRLGSLITFGGAAYELLKAQPSASEMTDAGGGETRPHTLENILAGVIPKFDGIVTSLFGEEGGEKFKAMREDVMSEGGLDRIKEQVIGKDGLSSDNGKLVRMGAIGLGIYFGAKLLGNITNRLFSGPAYLSQQMMPQQMMPQFAGGMDPYTMAMSGAPGGWGGAF